ncbi:5-oxoprolinase subunit B family protein [Cellulomonas fimi]|uniref:Allophanate hydrolase subunit 1 n=1 Tax=Cellulomonas fimi (strain ATCC 484 / DSM 20113 / JCM 1341 / CCUG 24087 / LMG 16345 / NBRC 15513 / NCIMB 8980 / NCTC 7547 / NRS-133) TaxID=590998 RepID=F4H0L1_CELFA|nr:allophanate hydrolase subunit 1 [Cellulomonas fimi]AEE44984.1 Allophanate hydrolase subunit 1 [Cellulomonas fimi ATCC 484]NNH09131.1 allophanate hydrolase subunit 1 [Cellulomonas fimi]VEH27885.1 Sporulation inhibitor kipI [Cellulomonas fimi]
MTTADGGRGVGTPGRAGDVTGAERIVPFGDDALLVELRDLDAVRALDDAVRAAREGGALTEVVDQVPAARTLLLRVAAHTDLATLAADVGSLVRTTTTTTPASTPASTTAVTVPRGRAPRDPDAADRLEVVRLDVVYDGEDLAEVAALTGLTPEEVVRRHTAATYTVAFGGFMPGFAYLVGLDPALRVPRRDSPRPRVPAGAVAVADEFTAVYPTATPGGWRLLGRCDAVLFDVARTPPALLVPGRRVRFVAAGRAR